MNDKEYLKLTKNINSYTPSKLYQFILDNNTIVDKHYSNFVVIENIKYHTVSNQHYTLFVKPIMQGIYDYANVLETLEDYFNMGYFYYRNAPELVSVSIPHWHITKKLPQHHATAIM